MIFNKCIFLLVVTLLCHERFVEAHGPMLRTFGILDAPKHHGIFSKVVTELFNPIMGHKKSHKSNEQNEQNEKKRQKIFRERILSQVRDKVFKELYGRF